MTSPNELKRPKELEFALEFCGDPEETLARQYIEALEARATLAQPEPVGAGEAAELVEWLYKSSREWRDLGEYDEGSKCHRAADILTRYAHPTTKPVPVAERFEFSVFNSEYEEQAGGTAPTYAEALSYGQHYLSQYSQDGPHSLEIRRVEVLPHHALPVPGAEDGQP
jgi:hypothetical protein